jgi:protein-disulfide isomerase
MTFLPTCLAAALLSAAAALPAAAQEAPMPAPQSSSPFSEGERAALHAEIRAYLLANPEVLTEMIQLLEQKQQAATAENDRDLVAMHAKDIFDDGFSWVGGNPDGQFTVVEFLDYQCGYCRRAQPDVTELVGSDGDIRLIVKEMPILGPGSDLAARAAVATLITEGPKSYGALHDRLLGLEGAITDVSLDQALTETGLDPAAIRLAMTDPEVERRLAATRALAEKLAISGTPTFVFDNRMVRGYLPLAQMRSLVSEVRGVN